MTVRTGMLGLITAAAAAGMVVKTTAGDVRLAEAGEARAVIVAADGTMSWEGDERNFDRWGRLSGSAALETEAERMRRLQRDSILDLAHYLGTMAGTEIDIVNIKADLGGACADLCRSGRPGSVRPRRHFDGGQVRLSRGG